MFQRPHRQERREIIEALTAAFRTLAFPICTLPSLSGMIGEVQRVDGEPVAYSLRLFPAERPEAIDVTTSLVDSAGRPRAATTRIPTSEPWPPPPARSTSAPTVTVDHRPLRAFFSADDDRWFISCRVDHRFVAVSGSGETPERLDLVTTDDVTAYIETWIEMLDAPFD